MTTRSVEVITRKQTEKPLFPYGLYFYFGSEKG